MASIINASSTGSGGIVQTADASGVLQLQANGTTALTVNADASVSLALAPSVNTTMASSTTYQTNFTLQAQPSSGTTGTSSAGGVQLVFQGRTEGVSNATLAAIAGFVNTNAVNNAGGLLIRAQESAGAGLVDAARITSGGLITLRGSTNTVSGSGIAFPASQSASSDANTLDDYEEGTCSVSFFDGTTNSATATAYYVKVGGMCSVTFALYAKNLSGLSTSHLRIAGLPFTATAGADGSMIGTITNNLPILCEISSGGTQGYLYSGATGGADIGAVTKSNFISATAASVWGQIFYRVA